MSTSRTLTSSLAIALCTLGCGLGLNVAGLLNATAASSAVAAKATALEVSDLINESGRLRMLSERMGKAYAQIALNVMPEKAQEQMVQSQKKFDDNLVFLRDGANTAELKAKLAAVAELYQQYLRALT